MSVSVAEKYLDEMEYAPASHPLTYFAVSTVFFYLAIQHGPGYVRQILNALHILSIAAPLYVLAGDKHLAQNYVFIPFVVYSTVHTVSVLCIEKTYVRLGSQSFKPRLQIIYRIWSNIRRMRLTNGSSTKGEALINFTFKRGCHAVGLWIIFFFFNKWTYAEMFRMNITAEDFAPENSGLLTPLTLRAVYLRAIISFYWILNTSTFLVGMHDFLAILFVSILKWDQPCEWPALFGDPTEAFSLRRFWGVFWQRLHIAPFESFMPSFFYSLAGMPKTGLTNRQVPLVWKAMRALWIFVLSATCHATINWVTTRTSNSTHEFRFFLSNYFLCLAETAGNHILRKRCQWDGGRAVRIVGYFWVAAVFFCIVPDWQYSLLSITLVHQ